MSRANKAENSTYSDPKTADKAFPNKMTVHLNINIIPKITIVKKEYIKLTYRW